MLSPIVCKMYSPVSSLLEAMGFEVVVKVLLIDAKRESYIEEGVSNVYFLWESR